MDDQRFDKAVKEKVGEYSDPAVDSGAIAGLHQQLDAYAPAPWYAAYKGAGLMAATLGVFTLINWGLISSQQPEEAQTATFVHTEEYETLINELRGELDRLQAAKVDTVYITLAQPSTTAGSQAGQQQLNEEEVINGFLLRVRNGEEIGEIGDYYFVVKDDVPETGDFIALNSRHSELGNSAYVPHRSYVDTVYKNSPMLQEEEQNDLRMPMVVVRDIEKHYSKGLGIRLGGEVELAMNLPDYGTGETQPGGGLLAELVFSPSLALETGIKYKNRSYEIDEPNEDIIGDYPDVDTSAGELEELEADAQLLEFPINLKYYRPVAQYKDLYFSVGVSPNLYLREAFEYGYETEQFDDNTIKSDEEVDEAKFHAGTFNAGVGMSFDLPKRRMAQVGLFYQKDIGGLGVENRGMNIVGIKSSYWFKVR